jgi:hypothetical protein
MLITFTVLAAAAAVSPIVWFIWWVLADAVESRSRHAGSIVAMPRAARASAAADRREKAA